MKGQVERTVCKKSCCWQVNSSNLTSSYDSETFPCLGWKESRVLIVWNNNFRRVTVIVVIYVTEWPLTILTQVDWSIIINNIGEGVCRIDIKLSVWWQLDQEILESHPNQNNNVAKIRCWSPLLRPLWMPCLSSSILYLTPKLSRNGVHSCNALLEE